MSSASSRLIGSHAVAGADNLAATLLESLESATTHEEYRRGVLREVSARLGGDAALAMPVPALAKDASLTAASFRERWAETVEIGTPAGYVARKAAGWDTYFEEIGPEAAIILGGHVALDHEVFGPQARARMALYEDVMRPTGVTSKLIGITRVRGRLHTVLILLRCGARFRPAACDNLAALMPLIALADTAAEARFAPTAPGPSAGAARPALAPTRGAGERLARFREGYDRLSPREREVVGMISRGLQNKEIATLLGTSPTTVRKQTIQAFRRLGTTGRVETAVLAVEALQPIT